MSWSNSTAPSSPPQNVMVTTFDPASLMVSWQPPPPIDHIGPLTGYVIQYTKVDGSSDMMTMTVSSVTTTHSLLELPVSTEYSVAVTAMNVNGTGPFSNAVVNISGEDREFN